MQTLKFERSFRIKVLALMLDNLWGSRYGMSVIKPEFFELEDEENIARAIYIYKQKFGHAPTDMDDIIALAGAEHADLVHAIFNAYEASDCELASDIIIQFAKEQAVKIAILEAVDDINNGDLTTPVTRMTEALKVGDSILSPGIDPIADVDKWLYNYWTNKVRTGLHHIDMVLEGGLGVPELGLIMAPANVGKSMALINIGFGAAMIGNGKNVVHFTHEMSVEQVSKRYAARLMFKFPDRNDDLGKYEADLLAKARKMMTGNIRVIGGAMKMDTNDITAHMDRLVAEGFEPGLIIDDYPDLVTSPKHYNERRFELSATYEWFRNLSDKYQCPVWGATQANRESFSREIITLAQISEDIGKAQIADVIVALCQTYEEMITDRCRLFMAKVRDGGKKNSLIACKFLSSSQAIITTEYVKSKDDQNDV